jgi:DNA-binding SARP family transcriptional activator
MFGTPQVWRDEQPVRFKTRKTLALVAYLADAGGLQPREQLAALLWPGTAGVDGRHNLRTTLVGLRQALGESALTVLHDAVGLDLSARHDLDLHALHQTQQLARAVEAGAAPGLRAQLNQAVALYRGPFLDGLDIPDAPEFESWLVGQRVYWQGIAAELLERLATLQAAAGDEAAQGTLERWVELEPGEERAWQHLLALALDRDDVVGARRVWAACRAALAELAVEPGPALQELAMRNGARGSLRPTSGSDTCTGPALDCPPLVGRAQPLAALRQAFVRAQTGLPQVVVLQGEAGIGKTRLASEFLAWARAQGADVLTGRAFATAVRLPYAPLVAALRPRLERENAPEDLLSDLWLTELARLLPELRERYPDLPSATEHPSLGHARLCEAVARLGLALAERRPMVIFLDDMQWMDRATRDLVPYMVRRWAESGVQTLVLVALRAEDVETVRVLAPWLGGLEREAATTRLELGRLTPRDVLQLVAALAGDAPECERLGPHEEEMAAFGQWLAEQTGGQPSFVIQMLQALIEEGMLRWRTVAGAGWSLDVGGAVRTGTAGSAPAVYRQARWAGGCRDAEAIRQDLLMRLSWLRALGQADGGQVA